MATFSINPASFIHPAAIPSFVILHPASCVLISPSIERVAPTPDPAPLC
jgi:hypothetical protein